MSSKSLPNRGDVFWANLEPVEGSEQGGSRPVLIISNNLMNHKSPVVIIVPMTTKTEKINKGIFNIPYSINSLKIDKIAIEALRKKGHNFVMESGLILSTHSRCISKRRLHEKIGELKNTYIIKKVEYAIKDAFALEACTNCNIPLRPNGLTCGACGRIFRTKCLCGKIISIDYNYCPHCGRRVNDETY
ncbi:MAG: Toxin-antitoxin addiction module toxin component MazF (an endoRNAse) [Clostridiales bacterium]|jgi:mRNA interferase MazF|nr:Toxin-antitoxin addiction module toxin component MazF (an endoRNAse) [Clostridiales bacterium]